MTIRLIPSFICLFISALSIALPNLTRRGMLFAVPVPADFRATQTARRSIAEYRALIVLAALMDVCALMFSPGRTLGAALVASPFVVLGASAIGFLRERRKLMPFAIQPSPVREATLSRSPDRVPWFIWLSAGPFVIMGGAALYLSSHWDSIPARFAVHWTMNGQPDAWSERSFRGVYGPVLLGAEMCLFMVALALGDWYGARRSRIRRPMLGTLVACAHMIAVLFAGVAIHAVVDIPVWLIICVPLAALLAILAVAVPKLRRYNEPIDPTPNQSWKAGMAYYHPEDPALFVEKRAGLGYTINFGNRWSWLLMAGLAAMIGSVFLLL
jgi:uncharacterized membrane protein